MKKYIFRVLIFTVPYIIMLFIVLAFIPPTPKFSTSLLFSKLQKDSLLLNVEQPRLLLIGGSNLSFGINSEIIHQQMQLNPVNTGIHAGIGLVYMMDSSLEYVQPGDIVILVPEYNNYFGNFAYGGKELCSIILNIAPSDCFLYGRLEWISLLPYIVEHAKSKLDYTQYAAITEGGIYGADSFNEYGDAIAHRELESLDFEPFFSFEGNFNQSVVDEITNFRLNVEKKGAIFLISYPCYQRTSFENCSLQIQKVQIELEQNNFNILGTPERYMMPESMMFNTPYHLTGEGADYRTNLLIEDLEKASFPI